MLVIQILTVVELIAVVIAIIIGTQIYNSNNNMLDCLLKESYNTQKEIYEQIVFELDTMPIQTRQVEKLRNKYVQKIVEVDEAQKISINSYLD